MVEAERLWGGARGAEQGVDIRCGIGTDAPNADEITEVVVLRVARQGAAVAYQAKEENRLCFIKAAGNITAIILGDQNMEWKDQSLSASETLVSTREFHLHV